MKPIIKKLFIAIVIFSFLISLVALPSFRPSHVALASDRSFIVALIGYKPIIVRLENNTAYAHFDGLDFQGGFVSSGDNFIFDLYAYTDNTTANLEFLYNSFQVMAPYRYALYKLENGIYKPVKSSQWHYAEIINIKRKMSESKKFSSNSLQTVNWNSLLSNTYFLWNIKKYGFSDYSSAATDSLGPIKRPSLISYIIIPDDVYEEGNCVPAWQTAKHYDYNKLIEATRFFPMAEEIHRTKARKVGFIMYLRGDEFVNAVKNIATSSCHKKFLSYTPDVTSAIRKINLDYSVDLFDGNKEDEYLTMSWSTGDMKKDFLYYNPSEKNSGLLLSPLANIISGGVDVLQPELKIPVGLLASFINAVETFYAKGNVYISIQHATKKDGSIGSKLNVSAHDGFWTDFYSFIPVIFPNEATKQKWHDVSSHLFTDNNGHYYPFTPFYISFNDSPETSPDIRKHAVINIKGDMWLETYVNYYYQDGWGAHSLTFTFKYPIRIQLRYRLVK